MAQFDVYEYAGPNRFVAYLLDVQSDLLRDLASRVVIPPYQCRVTIPSKTRSADTSGRL